MILKLGIILTLILLGVYIEEQYNVVDIPEEIFQQDTYTEVDCDNLTLFDTATCLNEYVKTFYKYTITNDNLTLSLEMLKEKGGDCNDWAMLYQRMFEDLNFTSKLETIRIDEQFGHRFLIAYDETGYCILDLDTKSCRAYTNERYG